MKLSTTNAYNLVVLDMAGTTVADGGLVERAFASAAGRLGVEPGSAEHATMLDYVRATMGESKISVFRHLFGDEDEGAARQRRLRGGLRRARRRRAHRPGPRRPRGHRAAAGRGPHRGPDHRLRPRHPGRDPRRARLAGPRPAHPVPRRRGRPRPPLPRHGAQRLPADRRGRLGARHRGGRRHLVRHAQRRTVRGGRRRGRADRRPRRGALTEAGATHVLDSVAELPGPHSGVGGRR